MSFVFRFREDLVAVWWEPAGFPLQFRNCRNVGAVAWTTRGLVTPCESDAKEVEVLAIDLGQLAARPPPLESSPYAIV